jgi:DNA-binding NarL/FixJ family response regulator
MARAVAATDRISHLQDELRAEYERRGKAVIEAVAEGNSYRKIGRAIHAAPATVYKIVTDWA